VAEGWRLKALQPFVLSGNQVRYTAVWEQSTAGEIQVYGWTYEDYRKKYDELWQKGWRLKALQPFVLSGNQVRYTAVWEQSTAGEIQVYGWTYEDYRKKYDELWQKGWRLKLLQPFVLSGNQVRYTAVWEQSTAGEIQVYGWTYEDYRKKYDELWQKGWRLKLLQPFVLSGNQVRYTAVWEQSTAGEIQVYGWTYEDYRKKYDELWQKGWRLKALQPYATVSDAAIRAQLVARSLAEYQRTGAAAGELGVPLAPVTVAGTSARWDLSGGHITTLVNGTGETVVDQHLKIWFLGFTCLEESSEWSGSDEPYFVISWAGPGREVTRKFEHKNIDKGQTVVSPVVIADNLPVVTSVLHAAVFEHDEGSPEEARKKVEKVMRDVSAAAAQAATAYDMASAASGAGSLTPGAALAGTLLGGPFGGLLAGGAVALLGLGDDYVGARGASLFDEAEGYAFPSDIGVAEGEAYTHKFTIGKGGEGRYDLFFRVRIINQPRPWAARG
jgi:hypothetical protein